MAFRKESEGLIKVGTAEAVVAEVERDIAAGEIRILEVDGQVEARFNAIMATCYRRTPPDRSAPPTPSILPQPK